MEEALLYGSPLFAGIEPGELHQLLECLAARQQKYAKGEEILHNGQTLSGMGLVLCGRVHIFRDDFWGNRLLLGEAAQGELFGEAYACLPDEPLGVQVAAATPAEVLFLDLRPMVELCAQACPFHAKLIRNLLAVLAQKNLMLTRKMNHMAKRTTREKLLSYLSAESQRAGSAYFTIPYNRQQLAEYLCVDRSAMSSELGRMQREGIVAFERSQFHLIRTEAEI